MPTRIPVVLAVALAIGCGGKGSRDYPPYSSWETPSLETPGQYEAAAEADQSHDDLDGT